MKMKPFVSMIPVCAAGKRRRDRCLYNQGRCVWIVRDGGTPELVFGPLGHSHNISDKPW